MTEALDGCANRFFAAIEDLDVAALHECCDAAATFHMNGRQVAELSEVASRLARSRDVFGVPVYSDVKRRLLPGVVIEEHRVSLHRPDGTSTVEALVVLEFDDADLIRVVREYAVPPQRRGTPDT